MGEINEALILLIILLVLIIAGLSLLYLVRHRTVRSWQPPSGQSHARLVIRGGRTEHHPGGSCCLEAACSEECARRQQAMHNAQYLSGLTDALQHPNRIRELIQHGQELLDDDSTGSRAPVSWQAGRPGSNGDW